MTPLEEKIEEFKDIWIMPNDFCPTPDNPVLNLDKLKERQVEWLKETLNSTATQAVEEERKRILDIEFRAPADKSDDWHAGIRYCLEKFRNTISKPNI